MAFKPLEFLREVKAEAGKVTWPTRKETGITTMMVLVMVILTALFFFLIDQLLNWGIGALLGLGN